jgi:hypothetical protein
MTHRNLGHRLRTAGSKRRGLCPVVLVCALAACSATTSASAPPHTAPHEPASCGAELSEDAVVPEQLAALMSHVANNMDAHARWVGSSSEAARSEREALTRLATHYRRIAASAAQAARSMRGMHELDAAPHDPARFDRQAFERWMRTKVALQRNLARLLLEHAATSERALADESAGAAEPGADRSR